MFVLGFFVRKKEAVVFTDKVHVHNLKVVFFFLVNSIIIVAVTVIYFGVVGEKLFFFFFFLCELRFLFKKVVGFSLDFRSARFSLVLIETAQLFYQFFISILLLLLIL